MNPEEMESLSIGTRSTKAAVLNPVQVNGHHPPKTYTNSANTKDHELTLSPRSAPPIPIPIKLTHHHVTRMSRANDKVERTPTIAFFICAWRYICIVMVKIKL